MSNWDKERLLRSTIIAGFAAAGLATGSAFAQQNGDDEDENGVDQTPPSVQQAGEDRVVVTGSRLRRDSFSSIAPLQVVDAEEIRERGLVDLQDVLNSVTVVTGTQETDAFSTGFISSGGPGSNTVSLRNLGAERTLVLINGRRFAPAGVEGAPTSPDVSLIPASLIARTEILLDGASSVYGSDAVAGVVNVILRDNFEGLQLEVFSEFPEDGGGAASRANILMGGSSADSSFVAAFEYFHRESMSNASRDWMYGDFTFNPLGETLSIPCSINLRRTNTTDISRVCNAGFQSSAGLALSSFGLVRARPDLPASAAALAPFGTPLYPTANLVTTAVDAANGGPTGLGDYALIVNANHPADYLPSSERFSFFTAADTSIDLPGLGRTTAFLELSYNNRQTNVLGGYGQISLNLPASNPLNPFGTFGPVGGIAPGAAAMLVLNPIRGGTFVEVQQTRAFGGLTGDLENFGLGGWDYEVFAGYTRSTGFSRRSVINETRLEATALTTRFAVPGDPTSGLICGNVDSTGGNFPQTPPQCVPVNFFAPELYPIDGSAPNFGAIPDPNYVGGFITPEQQRDWLAVDRDYYTNYEQVIAGGYVTGDAFTLPAGPVGIVIGAEWREDRLNSRASDAALRGDVPNFFFDQSSSGSVSMWEVYGEAELPLIRNQPFINDLTINIGGRYVDNEFYGQNGVYAIKAGWAVNDWLTFRGTYGTSFRAPNLNELFLEGQSGFQNAADPCLVPALAIGPGQTYNPGPDTNGDGIGDNDGRDPQVIANCQAEGLDPFSLGLAGRPGGVQIVNRGNTGLEPETSRTWTAGFVIEQPWTDAATLRLGVNYFNVKIEDSVFTPSATQILGQCYTSADFPNDPFCGRRERNPVTGFLQEVDVTSFNVGETINRGIDINLGFDTDFEAFGRFFDLSLGGVWTRTLEQSVFVDEFDPANPIFIESAGIASSPYWRALYSANLRTGNFGFNWATTYIGGSTSTLRGTQDYTTDTRILDREGYFVHTASVGYAADTWRITAGIRNITNEDPVQVHSGSADARNVPLGAGYDVIGRRLFVNVSKAF